MSQVTSTEVGFHSEAGDAFHTPNRSVRFLLNSCESSYGDLESSDGDLGSSDGDRKSKAKRAIG